jgi:hypothetical protein
MYSFSLVVLFVGNILILMGNRIDDPGFALAETRNEIWRFPLSTSYPTPINIDEPSPLFRVVAGGVAEFKVSYHDVFCHFLEL